MISTALRDTWTMTQRNIIRYKRIPTLLVFASIQPIMFLLLFVYVFGGAIAGSTEAYVLFLVPGLIAQDVIFGGSQTAVGLAEDMNKGVVSRFKSLPMNAAAVMFGRSLSDSLRNILVTIIIIVVGYMIGFEFLNGFWPAMAGFALVILFGFAVSWSMILLGLSVRDPESVNTASFLIIFPLVFASTVFVPAETLPDWLRVFVDNQPVTQVVEATRGLMVTGDGYDHIWKSLAWMAGLMAVFVPLSVRKYRKTS